MRPTSTSGGRSRSLLGLSLLVLGSIGTLLTLHANGTIELPFLSRTPEQGEEGPPPGTVAVPVSAAPIPAYTRITRDHFWDAKKGRFAVIYLRPEQIRPETITNLMKVIGRVLDHDKPAGYAFTEKDFLPAGTRPGVAAGVPDETRRGMVFDATRLGGIHGLKAGDHVDLIASLPVDPKNNTRPSSGRLSGAALVLAPGTQSSSKKASVRVLAHDAVIVTPVTTRQVPMTSSSLTQGMRVTTRPVQEVTIAVAVDEVAAVAEAVALEADIHCVVRTNRPTEKSESIRVPEPEESKVTVIETIHGNKRDQIVFPAAAEADRPSPKKE